MGGESFLVRALRVSSFSIKSMKWSTTCGFVLGISYEKAFKLKFSGNEVHYTACSLLVTLENSFSKLHCQKVLIEKPFHMKFRERETFNTANMNSTTWPPYNVPPPRLCHRV